jgi:cutinase
LKIANIETMSGLRLRQRVAVALAAVLAAGALTMAPAALPSAAAANCPGAELVFARGRLEPPGAGIIGNALAGALQSRGKNVGVYAVKYPANTEVDVGANDMSGHVQYMMDNCPNTRLVIGGYSLGAAVADVVLAVPFNFFGFKSPLPAGADGHIAAVALFGNGSQWVGPISNFNPVYKERTIEQCHGADPICNPGDPDTWQDNWPQHLANAYVQAGMVNQAADFVAGRI